MVCVRGARRDDLARAEFQEIGRIGVTAPGDRRRSGRRQLLLVASLFLVPLVAAIILYYSSGWRPAVNVQGTLIEPPLPLADAVSGSTLPDGRPADAGVFRDHWSIVYPAAACDAYTEVVLDELRRVRLALDKDAPRVRRVLLHDGACAGVAISSRDADLLVLAAAGARGGALLAAFPPAVDGVAGIYIVDPHGNLMMSYPASGSARGLLKDLERLLKLSHIG
jgi:hypothetical protein